MKIAIDMSFLLDALEDHSGTATFYLNKKTGEIIRVSEYDTEDEKKPIYDQIDAEPDRYVHIEPQSSRKGFEIMEDFVATLPDGEEKRTLERALSWQKPFSNFKNALREMPELGKRWLDYHDRRMMETAREWLESEGIEAEIK